MIWDHNELIKTTLGITNLPEPYPLIVLDMLSPEGFNSFVQTIYQKSGLTEAECYLIAEEFFKFCFGKERYGEYNNYKSSYWQIRNRLRVKAGKGV